MPRRAPESNEASREAARRIAEMRPARRRRLTVDPELREQLLEATAPRREDAVRAGCVEDYGLDPGFRERAEPLFKFVYESYWRCATSGSENVPATGPCILIGNHSGGLPFDAMMVAYALSSAASPGRVVRPLYDRFVEGMGPVKGLYRKLGGVPANYAVADELLERDEVPVIFPEGVGGVAKLYDERYVVGHFSTSAARLSCRHRVPVIPFAVIGAEETYPMIGRSAQLGKLLGAPYVPITPFFPMLGLAGMIPLPTKWTIAFGKRIYLYRESRFRGPGCTEFEAMSERLRRTVQVLVDRHLDRRSSIFLG